MLVSGLAPKWPVANVRQDVVQDEHI